MVDRDAVEDHAGVELVEGLPPALEQERPAALDADDRRGRPAAEHLVQQPVIEVEPAAVADRQSTVP